MNKSFVIRASLTLAIASLGIAPLAQLTPTDSHSEKRPPSLSVPFFANDGHGNPVSGLSGGDLSILDNKKPVQSIVSIRQASQLPLRLGVLIDTSNSQRKSGLYQPGVEAASEFLSQVVSGSDDKVFIVNVNTIPSATEFMNRDQLLRFKIDLTPSGATALFDAISLACKKRMEADPAQSARRVLVILSDGDDTQSRLNLDKAIAAAQQAGTVIFAVSTSDGSHGYLDVYNRRLAQMAEKTGGQAFLDLSRKDMTKVFSKIRTQIDNMYSVTYVPSEYGRPGDYRTIELKVTSGGKTEIRAPRGYYLAVSQP